MPLPTDPQTLQTSRDLVSTLHQISGSHPGFRPLHAKGILLTGSFTPSSLAPTLSKGPHFTSPSTPLTIRFSSSTGLPTIPDTDPTSNPRGIAIRFQLGEHKHTDIIAHSTPFFPTRTGEEFLAFLKAAMAPTEEGAKESPVQVFLKNHPATLAFVQAPKPPPSSFAREMYWGVNAYKLINSEGKETFVRYRIVPDLGVEHLDEAAVKEKGPEYLYEEIAAGGRLPVGFKLTAQVAEKGDTVDDCTVHWPEEREVVELGKVELVKVVEEEEQRGEQKKIIFDPVPRVEGVEGSGDPLIELRAGVYLVSGRERRAA